MALGVGGEPWQSPNRETDEKKGAAILDEKARAKHMHTKAMLVYKWDHRPLALICFQATTSGRVGGARWRPV